MTVLDDIAATFDLDHHPSPDVSSPYSWVPGGGGGGVVVAGSMLLIGYSSVGGGYVPASPWRLRGSLDPLTYAHVISLFYDEAAPATPDDVGITWAGGGGPHQAVSGAVTVPASDTTPVQTAFGVNSTPTLTFAPSPGNVGIVYISNDSGGLSSTPPAGWQYLGGLAGYLGFFGRVHEAGDLISLPFALSGVGATSTLGYSEWVTTPPVIACFTPGSTTITEGDTVHFADCTTGGTVTAWSWTFGDGGTSSSQNPSHQYAAHGTFNVTLTVTVGGIDYTATGVVHSQADVGYTPPLPGLALVEIYATSPGSARWDQANWDEAVWSSDSWQNVTPESTDVQIIWGSQRPELGILSTPDAASWAIGFYDPQRLLDPANSDSPFFGDIVPGLPVRVTHRGWVVRQGLLESAGHTFDLNSFQVHNSGYFRVTDSQSLMARSQVPSDTMLGDDLFSRTRDAIAAAGLSVHVVPETFATSPIGDVSPIGHVHDLVPWVTGVDWSVWQWITDAAAQVLHVPYIDRHGNLGFRQWNLPKDYGKELASPNLVGLGSVIFQNGTYSIVEALDDDGVTLRTAELTPKPYYGAVTYDDRATKPTPNAQDWADAVLQDRAVAGLRWVPGEVFPLTANDVRRFAEIEAIERVDIDYPEANPPISATGIVVGGQIVITPVQEREARWSFLFQVAATEDQPLVDDDSPTDFLVNDDDPTDYLYPG